MRPRAHLVLSHRFEGAWSGKCFRTFDVRRRAQDQWAEIVRNLEVVLNSILHLMHCLDCQECLGQARCSDAMLYLYVQNVDT